MKEIEFSVQGVMLYDENKWAFFIKKKYTRTIFLEILS